MNEKRPPDYNLCCKARSSVGKWLKIGAGWTNDRGGINIVLDYGEKFPDLAAHILMLFINDRDQGSGWRTGTSPKAPKAPPAPSPFDESKARMLERRRKRGQAPLSTPLPQDPSNEPSWL